MPVLDIDESVRTAEQCSSDEYMTRFIDCFAEHREDRKSAARALLLLKSGFSSKMLISMYVNDSIDHMKLWAYNAAKCNIFYTHYHGVNRYQAHPPRSIYALLSDSPEMIHWYSQYWAPIINDSVKGLYSSDTLLKPEHFYLQFLRAMAGKWDQVEHECAQALDLGEKTKAKKWNKTDHMLLHSLAIGDAEAAQVAFNRFFSRYESRRVTQQAGFDTPALFMNCWAVMYARLAKLRGITLDHDSPWFPSKFVTANPAALKVYDCGVEAFDQLDIFAKFNDDLPRSWAPKASLLTPKPLGQHLEVAEVRGLA